MTDRLTLGYREATATRDTLVARAGERFRGHEFHYSQVEPASDGDGAAWELRGRDGVRAEGFARGGLHASYLHVHWAAFPQAAGRVVAAAVATRS